LVEAFEGSSARDEAQFYELRFVPQPIVPRRPRHQESSMNASLRTAPMKPLPARWVLLCPKKSLKTPTTLYKGCTPKLWEHLGNIKARMGRYTVVLAAGRG
jgi:hypothetical protein